MSRSTGWLGRIVYGLLILASVCSFIAAYVSPVADLNKTILAAPGLAAFSAMAVQALRDKQEFDRNRELEEREQGFTLGIVSHMAQVVFDKEVEFCEKYSEAVSAAVVVLLEKGPSEDALSQASKLSRLRDKYSLWVPEDLHAKLSEFEMAMREIGAAATVLPLAGGQADRMTHAEVMVNRLQNILGIQPTKGDVKPEIAAAIVNESLRGVLGAADYRVLRGYALKAAKRWAEGA